MALRVQCPCGMQQEVRVGQAGSHVVCACGSTLVVPALRELLVCAARGKPAPAARPTTPHRVAPGQMMILLTATKRTARRISHEALMHFVAACGRATEKYLAALQSQPGVDIQVACALLPDSRTLVEIQAQPDILPAEAVSEISQLIEQLPPPSVVDGPVAFLYRTTAWGGCPVEPEFRFPFLQYFQRSGDLDDLLMEAGGVRPQAATGLRRQTAPHKSLLASIRAFFSRRGSRRLSQRSGLHRRVIAQHVEPQPETAETQARSYATIEQVTAVLDGTPRSAPLYHRLGDLHLDRGELEAAIAAYTEAAQLDPADSRYFRARGVAHCAAGTLQAGLADFSTAIELNPRDTSSLAARARIFVELNAWERAEEDFSAAIRIDSRQPGLWLGRAQTRCAQQAFDAAMRDLETVLQLDPHHHRAYALRGMLRRQRPGASIQDVEDAVQDFTQAMESSPNHPWLHTQRAEAFVRQRKFQLAVDDCNRAIEVDSGCTQAYAIRGYAQQQLENYDLAVSDCTKAIELGCELPAVYISRATGYYARGDLELAVADCDSAIVGDPTDAAAVNLRGMLRLALGDPQAAERDFAEATRLAPQWALPYGHRANVHRLQSEHRLAAEDYTRCIELQPGNAVAYLNRALTWANLDEWDKARQDLNDAIRIDPDLAAGYLHRAELEVRSNELEPALADLDRALTLEPNLPAARYLRANIMLRRGRTADALRDYDALIRLDPSSPLAYLGRANVWIHIGREDKASSDYREAVELDPGSAEAFSIHLLLAESARLHELGKYEAAIAKATEAIDLDPQCAPAFAARGASHWYSEQYVEAAEDYSRLLQLWPQSIPAYSGRGQVLAEMGEYDAALADLEQAVDGERRARSNMGLAFALNGRALALAGLERWEEAERDFAESIDLCPGNAWVHYNRGLVLFKRAQRAAARDALARALESNGPPLTTRKRQRAVALLAANDASRD